MTQTRPSCPPDVKRLLRQEAGFGCCRCGFPIYDYHHIVEYSSEHHFRPKDMMLLCPNCHRMASNGALSVKQQREFKTNPHNRNVGYANGQLTINQVDFVVSSGGVDFVGGQSILLVDGESLLALGSSQSGSLLLSATLYNNQDQVVAQIIDNEWISSNSDIWDLEAGFQYMVIRNGIRDLALTVDARCDPIQIHAKLWRKGCQIVMSNQGVQLAGPMHRIVSFKDLCLVDLAINIDTVSWNVSISPMSPEGTGVIVSNPNHDERIHNGIDAYHRARSS